LIFNFLKIPFHGAKDEENPCINGLLTRMIMFKIKEYAESKISHPVFYQKRWYLGMEWAFSAAPR